MNRMKKILAVLMILMLVIPAAGIAETEEAHWDYEVDVVSGATITSNAFIEALKNAIEKMQ